MDRLYEGMLTEGILTEDYFISLLMYRLYRHNCTPSLIAIIIPIVVTTRILLRVAGWVNKHPQNKLKVNKQMSLLGVGTFINQEDQDGD